MAAKSAKRPIVLEESFKVIAVNGDGRKFQRVSRLECQPVKPDESDTRVVVDINSDVYPIDAGQGVTIALAFTLNLTGEEDTDTYDHGVYHRETVMTPYEYVMHGKVFKCNTDDLSAAKAEVLISFGGLLMKVEGSSPAIRDLKFNQNYYFLLKKNT